MSLLKVRKLDTIKDSYESLQRTFLEVLDTSIGDYKKEDLLALLSVYTTISIKFLQDISLSLEKPKGVEDTMKLMNSYIVEIMYALDYKYYHKEEQYSVIDKLLQLRLDGEDVMQETVEDILQDVNDSYVELEELIEES